MGSILYKYRKLLTEGYNFTNADEVYNALEANQIGVKTQPEYKEKIKWDYTCEKLRIFFRKCEEYGIKDTTYGVQLLLSKVPPNNLENIIRTDGFYELLKSRKKPWVKELKEFQTLMDDKVWLGATVNDLQVFEKAVQEGQSKHGKSAKGSGDIEGVKTLYDDGIWRLLQPISFVGEKAAAFYIKDGRETPTEWCTRCDESYYRRYTKQAPLYIIRNMKTGKSYQMAFEEDDGWDGENYVKVHFLDQNDVKGDEITQGDLSKIPDELLKHIPIPVGKAKGKTMADYKTDPKDKDPRTGKSGFIEKGKEHWSKEQIIDKKYQREALKAMCNNRSGLWSVQFKQKYGFRDIVKIMSIKGSFEEEGRGDSLTDYVKNGKATENKYHPKARKTRYYFLGHPDSYVEIIASKSGGIKPTMNGATADGDDRYVLQYTGFCEMGASVPTRDLAKLRTARGGSKSDIVDFLSKSTINAAKRKWPEAKKEYYFKKQISMYAKEKFREDLLPSTGLSIDSIDITSLDYRKKPFDSLYDEKKIAQMSVPSWQGQAPGTKWSAELVKGAEAMGTLRVMFPKVPLKKEEMKCWIEDNSRLKVSEEMKNICFEVSQHIFNTWRKQFHGEIIQNRAEGNYKNIYESNIVDRFRKLIKG